MTVEIEAKMKVDDHAPIRQRLHECGAERIGEFMETNTFFDTSDRTLLSSDCGLRLREQTNLATNQQRVILTYKGPSQMGSLKTRDEIELSVSSASDANDLLRSLQYEPTLSFQKERQSWLLDECHVELDELPYLGAFVEIEGQNDAAILRVREKLGLAGRPVIKTSYVAMLAELVDQGTVPGRKITFPAVGPRSQGFAHE